MCVGKTPGSEDARGRLRANSECSPSRAHVTRGKVLLSSAELRYVLFPSEKSAASSGYGQSSPGPTGLVVSCDALRCSGPHARYTDRANEFLP
jgi:hypothetical protein